MPVHAWGLAVAHEPRPIEAAIAVRYPTAVESAYDLAQAISAAQLSFCVLYDDGSRFPQFGWLTGSVTDLADLIRLVSVPSKAVEAGRRRVATGHRAGRYPAQRYGRVAAQHHASHCPAPGHGRRAPNPPHGLRHHRQRAGLSPAHRRNVRPRKAPGLGLRPQRGQPAAGNAVGPGLTS